MTMVVDERLFTYISSLDGPLPEYLDSIRQQAVDEEVPIIRTDMQMLMKWLMTSYRPKRILEIGAAVGFSALLMAEYDADAQITTIENYEPRIVKAKENIASSPHGDRVKLLEGDAADILPSLTEQGKYDFVFMDAAKGQYPALLPVVLGLMDEGAVLVTDNVLFDGDIIESKYLIKRRNRTIHTRMREYLYTLTHTDGLVTTVLPVGDGVSLSVKKNGQKL